MNDQKRKPIKRNNHYKTYRKLKILDENDL